MSDFNFYGPIPLPAFKLALRSSPDTLSTLPQCGPLSTAHFQAIFDAGNPAPNVLKWNAANLPLPRGAFDILVENGCHEMIFQNIRLSDQDFSKALDLYVSLHTKGEVRISYDFAGFVTTKRAYSIIRSKSFLAALAANSPNRYAVVDLLDSVLSVLKPEKLGVRTVKRLIALGRPTVGSFLLEKEIPLHLKVQAARQADWYRRLVWLSSDEGMSLPFEDVVPLLNAPGSVDSTYKNSAYDKSIQAFSIDAAAYLFWRRPELIEPAINSGCFLLLEGVCKTALTPSQQELLIEKWPSAFAAFRAEGWTTDPYSVLSDLNGDHYSNYVPGPVVMLSLSGRNTPAERFVDSLSFLEPSSDAHFEDLGSGPKKSYHYTDRSYARFSAYFPSENAPWSSMDVAGPYRALLLVGKRGLSKEDLKNRRLFLRSSQLFALLLERDGFRAPRLKGDERKPRIWNPWDSPRPKVGHPQRISPLNLDAKFAYYDHGFATFRRRNFSLQEWATVFALLLDFTGTLEEFLTAVKELS